MNLEVPRRAQIIRTIMLELERLHSHFLAIGLTLESIGFENLFMLCFRNREVVLDVFERTTGNRILHGINLVGGVTRNIGPEMAKEIMRLLRRDRKALARPGKHDRQQLYHQAEDAGRRRDE